MNGRILETDRILTTSFGDGIPVLSWNIAHAHVFSQPALRLVLTEAKHEDALPLDGVRVAMKVSTCARRLRGSKLNVQDAHW